MRGLPAYVVTNLKANRVKLIGGREISRQDLQKLVDDVIKDPAATLIGCQTIGIERGLVVSRHLQDCLIVEVDKLQATPIDAGLRFRVRIDITVQRKRKGICQ